LPKGKLDEREKPEECALREVCEETGVCNTEIISFVKETFHSYTLKRKNILKKTYWYEMKCNRFDGFRLQEEEDIQKAKWFSKEELKSDFPESYPLIKEMAADFFLNNSHF